MKATNIHVHNDTYIGTAGKNHAYPRNPRSDEMAVSVFDLMVWAYRGQGVQYEVDRHPEFAPKRWRGNLVEDLLGWRKGYSARGCINGMGSVASIEAHIIHAHVRTLSNATQHLIIKCGENGKAPNWDPVIPPFRLIPDWKGQKGRLERIDGELVVYGTFRKIWSAKRKWIGCRLREEGTPAVIGAAILDRARKDYRLWYDGLAKLEPALAIDPRLAEIPVRGIGAEKDPWLRRDCGNHATGGPEID